MRKVKSDVIIGRQTEKSELEKLFNSNRAEFLAIYGRRRVGKTYLIKTYFQAKSCIFFRITGLKDASLTEQLYEFTRSIEKSFYSGETAIKEPTSWIKAFEMLTTLINKQYSRLKIVLFFDEVPWLASKRSRFLQAVDYYWNTQWSDNKRIKLIVCGSAASWVLQNIVNNKAGLHNRITSQIRLEPFKLNEVRAYLAHQKIKLNYQQLLLLYMVTGGIPHYLNHFEKGKTASQLIDKLCFTKEGILFQEFDNLFSSLFDESDIHLELIRVIASNHYGIARNELLQITNKPSGGRINQRLNELEEAGFIDSFIPHGHTKRGVFYRVIDEYTLFYLYWIEPNKNSIRRKDRTTGYWEERSKLPTYKTWAGYAFEAICYKHIAEIRKALHISAGANVGSWRYSPRTSSKERGAQIDLLFDRTDGAITICELKFTEHPFLIDKDYAQLLLNKVDVYRKQNRTTKQIFIAMVTSVGLKPSMYSEEIIAQSISADALFNDE